MATREDTPPTPGTQHHPLGVGRPRTLRRRARRRWARLGRPGPGFRAFWAQPMRSNGPLGMAVLMAEACFGGGT